MRERSEEIARGMAYAEAKPALAAWRAAHPRATMREIEDAVEEQVAKLRAEFLTEVAQQSEAEVDEQHGWSSRPSSPGLVGATGGVGTTRAAGDVGLKVAGTWADGVWLVAVPTLWGWPRERLK